MSADVIGDGARLDECSEPKNLPLDKSVVVVVADVIRIGRLVMDGGKTVADLAREASGWFEVAKRSEGESFTRLRDGAPEWLTELVYAAHGGFLPDDWRYGCIADAVEWITEMDDPLDSSAEFADDQVDAYTGARLEWLSSNLRRAGYCDDAVSNGMIDASQGIIDVIGAGQYEEAGEVYGLVLGSLEALAAQAGEES